jgi:hypothetical protein
MRRDANSSKRCWYLPTKLYGGTPTILTSIIRCSTQSLQSGAGMVTSSGRRPLRAHPIIRRRWIHGSRVQEARNLHTTAVGTWDLTRIEKSTPMWSAYIFKMSALRFLISRWSGANLLQIESDAKIIALKISNSIQTLIIFLALR